MKKIDTLEVITRLGSKSQIVLRKDIREALGLKPGSIVKIKKLDNRAEIKPVTKEEMITEVERIAKMIGKKWPKGKTSVDLIRQERD